MKKYILDIPVYRLSEENYYNEFNKYLEEHYNNFVKKSGFYSYQEFKYKKESLMLNFYGGMWKYNEIIGFIKLYILGTQIRGEYYQNKSERIRKTRKKQFIFKTFKLVPEIDIRQKTDNEIYEQVILYLKNCQIELNKRYIEIEEIIRIGKFIKWNEFINS